jgi:hypothetical protein
MNLPGNLISSENERDWKITANTCTATYIENNSEIFVIL